MGFAGRSVFRNNICQLLNKLQIVGLEASCTNRSSQVLKVFHKAIRTYGRPARVRGDKGGENFRVALEMYEVRGLNKGSYLFGTQVPPFFPLYYLNILPDQHITPGLNEYGERSVHSLHEDGKHSSLLLKIVINLIDGTLTICGF